MYTEDYHPFLKKNQIKSTDEPILRSDLKDSWSFHGGCVGGGEGRGARGGGVRAMPYCAYMSMSYLSITEVFNGNMTKTRLYNFDPL